MGWRAFGFRRGVNMVMGMAMDVWANIAHTLLAAFSLVQAVRRKA